MSKASEKRELQQAAIDYLRTLFPPGSTVATVPLHVSRSGMLRSIGVLAVEDGEVKDVSWAAARALDWRLDRDRGGVKVQGCGMDMGFHLVCALSATLYPDGFGCVGERCPSNDHSNGDRDFTPHGHRPPVYDGPESLSHWHRDGGYALRHYWI